ncbi:MAG: RNA polymerase sigma factor [Prosthecobacter sp.]
MHPAQVSASSRTTDSSSSAAASAALYRRHWPMLCSFARSRGCEPHDAEDAVQELFAKLVGQGQHERAAAIPDDAEQAAFLLARLRTHLIKRWRHRTRQRRGGGTTCFSLTQEEGAEMDIADTRAAPDAELDRGWARGVLDHALNRISVELQSQGRAEVWGCLERSVVEGGRCERPLNGALRVALHRAKRRLQELIRAQVRGTDEIMLLHAVLA